jgi:hypothetical protein
LSYVTSTSYVGVASTEQADGKEVAKQIIIFPEELRGAAEGSVVREFTRLEAVLAEIEDERSSNGLRDQI